jgi:hypothetical protein
LRVVSAGVCNDASAALIFGERKNFVVGAAELESAYGLEVFELEEELAVGGSGCPLKERSVDGDAMEKALSPPNVRQCDHRVFRASLPNLSVRVAICYHNGMSQPVKLSDGLVLDARLAGDIVERSIARQVEFWAKLGRAIEQLLQTPQVLALCQGAGARALSSCLESVDSPEGRRRVSSFLQSQPFPHYEPHPSSPGLLVRIDGDGRRSVGRFINRKFRPAKRNGRIGGSVATRASGKKK